MLWRLMSFFTKAIAVEHHLVKAERLGCGWVDVCGADSVDGR